MLSPKFLDMRHLYNITILLLSLNTQTVKNNNNKKKIQFQGIWDGEKSECLLSIAYDLYKM